MIECIAYRGGYAYQLKRDYGVTVEVRPPKSIKTQFVGLGADGLLEIRSGYAWDGPSGPAIDTQNFMRGSLVHDALYQLMDEGLLDPQQHRVGADRELRKICLEDGMSALRAWWVFFGVCAFGGATARAAAHPMMYAPKQCEVDA
jgi:hypothetical protein